MDPPLLLFFLTVLFMGWSLGANDAANVFGTAVGTRMVRFCTAALVSSVCVVIGAVTAGKGASEGLSSLVTIDRIQDSSLIALSAGATVLLMTRFALPVSTSQALIGSISGFMIARDLPLDISSLTSIWATWVYGPVLAGITSALLYLIFHRILMRRHIHLLTLDRYNRILLIAAGAAGSYALGANNIANVTGLFISSFTAQKISVFPAIQDTATELFLIGSLAIALGIITYSKRVMMSVGSNLFELSPVAAFIVVLSTALVLFLFSSVSLHIYLVERNLPAPPLIPVSQSQASVGAVIGIAVAKRAWSSINVTLLVKIAAGWVATPLSAALISFIFMKII